MKDSLLAPFEKRPISAAGSAASQSSGTGDMENKYKGIFGFGTPKIVANKRMKDMNQDQLRSQLTLHRLWGNSMAGGQSKEDEERDSNNFKKSSASEFFKRTRAAELELKNKHNQEANANKDEAKNKPPNSKEAVKRRLLNFGI
jgi:hypothetical protein